MRSWSGKRGTYCSFGFALAKDDDGTSQTKVRLTGEMRRFAWTERISWNWIAGESIRGKFRGPSTLHQSMAFPSKEMIFPWILLSLASNAID